MRLPSLRRLFEPSGVAAVAVLASIPTRLLRDRIIDPDLWWHLRTGRMIVADHRIPHADVYSYSAPGADWIVQEWGAEVFFHGLRRAFGLYGILVWKALMLFVIYALVARILVRRMGSGIGTWVWFGLVAYAGSSNWTERPNLFSFLLLVVTLELLDKRNRSIWWFVPIVIVWANLHGMVILGIGTVALVAVSETIKWWTRWEGADGVWARRLWAVAAAGLAASLVNPRGPGLLVHAFRLVRVVGNLVTEWASPDFHKVPPILFMVVLIVSIAAFALHPKKPDLTDLALGLAFTVLALQAARNLAVGAIVLGVVAARYLPGAAVALRERATEGPAAGAEAVAPRSPLIGAVALVVTLSVLGVVCADGFPSSDDPRDIVAEDYPLAAIAAIDRPGVRVFALDFWAGYIIDRSWPSVRVYHDTRVDVYGETQTRRYARLIAGLPGWDRELNRSCTTHVLVDPSRHPLAETLRLSQEWRIEREDPLAVTFARAAPVAGCERFANP